MKILLLEDDHLDAGLASTMLKRALGDDLEITHSASLADAISIAKSGQYDAAVVDLNVADSKGLFTLDKFNSELPGLPTIVHSGIGDADIAMMAVRLGAQDYLLKGETNWQALGRAVSFALARTPGAAGTAGEISSLSPDPFKAEFLRPWRVDLSPVAADQEPTKVRRTVEVDQLNLESLKAMVFLPDQPAFESVVQRVLLGETVEPIPLRVCDESGKPRHILRFIFPEVDKIGDLLAVNGADLELDSFLVTCGEGALAQNQLNRVLSSTLEGVFVWDLRTGETQFGRHVLTELQLSPDMLGGGYADLLDRIHPDDRAREIVARSGHFEAALPYDCKVRLLNGSGEYRWVRLNGRAERDSACHLMRLVGTLTHLDPGGTMLESALQALPSLSSRRMSCGPEEPPAEPLAMSKMRDRLIGMMVHDLRTPLSSVNMALELMGDPPNPSAVDVETWRLTREQVELGLELCAQLLDLRRIEQSSAKPALKLARVEVSVQRAVGAVSALAVARKIALDVYVGSLEFFTDHEYLRRILLNLLSNAVRYSRSGTKVGLKARMDGSDLVLTVSDTGPGVAEEDYAKVFDLVAMATSDSRLPGAGIGLAFCKQAAELLGGHISIQSRPGSGSTFEVRLPRCEVATPWAVLDAGSAS